MKHILFSAPAQSASASAGLLVLRLAFGGFMLVGHGWGKLMKFSQLSNGFPDPLGIGHTMSLVGAVSSEVLFAALLAVGLFTRLSAVPLAFTMLIAAFVIHGADPVFAKGGPSKELALLFLAAYLTILLTGPGRYSIDAMISKDEPADA